MRIENDPKACVDQRKRGDRTCAECYWSQVDERNRWTGGRALLERAVPCGEGGKVNGFEKAHERILAYTDAGQSWKGEEIVRCRDCKYAAFYHGEHEYREPLFCAFHDMDVKPENFCSWGKARSER